MKNKLTVKLKPYILLFPVLIFLVGIFMNGIILGLMQSLGYFPVIGLVEITFDYYKQVLTDPTFYKSLLFSLYISFTQAFLSLVLGILFAYALTTQKKVTSKLAEGLYKIPIMIPHTVVALIVFLQFTQSGWFARLLFKIGIISDMSQFPTLIFDEWGIGIILSYVFKGLPFIALLSIDIIRESYAKYAKIAQNLGANSFQVLSHVILPLTLPSAFSGFIILFSYSLGAFEIPFLLGASSPKALPVNAYMLYNSLDLNNRPNAMVVNMIIAICSFLLVGVYFITYRFIKRSLSGGRLNE